MRRIPSFSHKDYVFLADIIANLLLPGQDHGSPVYESIARQFADALRGTNPSYSRDRFLAAATGQPYSGRDVAR